MKWNNSLKIVLGILVAASMVIFFTNGFAQSEEGQGPPQMQSGRAQEGMIGDQPSQGGGFMERFDKDKDGKITKEEFSGPEDMFGRLDANGDGVIEESEAPTGPPGGGSGPPQMQSGREQEGMIGDQPGQGRGSMEESEAPAGPPGQ